MRGEIKGQTARWPGLQWGETEWLGHYVWLAVIMSG
jgi:hypothetical protein